jgi:GH15 family glucan-1,4-alpha-glucosidase
MVQEIDRLMDEPDAGIWEFRGKKQKHLGTYVFHWAGAKAALKMARHYKDKKLEALAIKVCGLAEVNIEKCYNPKYGCYMSDQTTGVFDATAFLLITMNYLDPSDEKTKTFFKRLEKELITKEGMIYRYQAADDFGETHATFLICTYWYIESQICLGHLKDAEESLRNIIAHSNHMGLLSEDLSSDDGSQWGNFPQTYSHVGLINAVWRLAKKLDRMVFE